jgi:hypothetical protein
LFYFWYSDEGGWEAFIGLCTSIFVFLGSFFSYVFYTPQKNPKLEVDIEGKSRGKDTGKDANGDVVRRPRPNVIYKYQLSWGYTFFIRNNSSYPAFKPRFHLRDEFEGLIFPELNRYKPIVIGWMSEMHVDKISRLHSKDPIKASEKYAIEAKFTKGIETDKDTVHDYIKTWFPPELEDLEFVLEYSNEDGEKFYTLFKRTASGKLINTISNSKPFYYTWGGALIKKLLKKIGLG